jgi:MHS family proline/betaine transporter-like MFS transporter
VGFYLCFVFSTTWLHNVAAVPVPVALLLNSIGLGLMMVMTPFLGSLSDRIGRKTVLFVGAGGLTLLSVPLLLLMGRGTTGSIVLGQFGFEIFVGCFAGAGPAFMVEAFPKHVRCSGLSVGYNLAMSIFGGTLPMVAVYLITSTGDVMAPAWYLVVAAIISGWMTAIMHPHEAEAA